MGEKRYEMMTTIIDPFPIWDTVEEKGYNCTDTLSELVDLLNNLTEENERLDEENVNLLSDRIKDLEMFEEVADKLESFAEENKQLKTQINIFETFLEENDLDVIEWEEFCTLDSCIFDEPNFSCKECVYIGGLENE